MKKTGILLLTLITVITLTVSCGKEDDIVDCFGESLLLSIHHYKSAENLKEVNFTVKYSGDHPFDNTVKWNFGDGTPVQTFTGKEAKHTYQNPGSYTAKATVSLNNGKCSYDLDETVTIE